MVFQKDTMWGKQEGVDGGKQYTYRRWVTNVAVIYTLFALFG